MTTIRWFEDRITPHLSSEQAARLREQITTSQTLPSGWYHDDGPVWLRKFIISFQDEPILRDARWLLDLWIKERFLTEIDPPWLKELEATFQARIAHQFILHFNVNDYVFDVHYGFYPLREYLSEIYSWKRRHYVIYNLSQGVTDGNDNFLRQHSNDSQTPSNHYMDEFRQLLTRYSLGRQNATRFMENPDEALQAIELLLRHTPLNAPEEDLVNALVIFDYAEKIVPEVGFQGQSELQRRSIETLQRWALDEQIRYKKNMVLLLTHNIEDIAREVRAATSQTYALEIGMPDEHDRLKFASWLYYNYLAQGREINFSDARGDFPTTQASKDHPIVDQLRQFAKRTSGLNRVGIHDIFRRAFRDRTPITSNLVQQRREILLSSESRGLLQSIRVENGLDAVGGMEKIKYFLQDEVVKLLRSGEPNTPPGILFLGPPGTGKTLVAEGLAHESGVSLVKLGNFRSQYVGESERNLSLALNIIRSMAPVIVFIDELDQSEGSRKEGNLDSGVSNRIFGRLLEEIGNPVNRGRVVWIGASNRPDLIDDAMRRSGRFDDKIPFLMPDTSERQDIFRKVLKHKQGITDENYLHTLPLGDFAAMTEGYTGAEIESVVSRAARKAALANQPIGKEHIEDAIKTFILGERSIKAKLMTLLALAELNDATFIPTRYRDYFDENDRPNEKLKQEIEQLQRLLR